MKLRLGVLASGRGTNLQAMIDSTKRGDLEAQVAVVVVDQPEAQARERARQAGIPEFFVDYGAFPDRESAERRIISILERHEVELVCLAGFMRILTPVFLNAYKNRVMNIHPSLLPAFPGIGAQRQALEHGVRYTGCTVHFVDQAVDAGPIIMQAVVPVHHDDTVESLSERILEQEHCIYLEAIQLYLEGRLELEGRRVRIHPEKFTRSRRDRCP
ncbi:phosphoribosylglycinamide formyltransferase [Candidatus Desulforudis audaxviator]|uniref:Phosphoribosylglycinamide formyltransferase n=1 Tax=Desulforudis audaxviator (strain MP104C) TaxID=477974 RepID=B1I580_DESAP|nr:phosphoribosylglycinamide formyltransferase [Candidatus Desulforudis audaxviator]ACA60132.1 phosphoribosylglycinamide formyltransferase [Candidatus Desulforudis audaxviator MP104C]AZK60168.1 Phosphoribosylglycinamide formyltransferase [Candidatus Desulforudis audaxviator]